MPLSRSFGSGGGSLSSFAFRLAAVALACAGVRCAHMEPPSGGPIDSVPPAVVAVYPPPGARNVPQDAPVVIQFSEWIERNVARNQAFVSPPLRGKLRVVAEGDKLQVRPSEASGGWKARTAYQVTVLPALQDLHGVKAGKPFVLRFSTGPTIDSATVAGSLLSDGSGASNGASGGTRGPLMAALYRAGDRAGIEALSARATGFQAAAVPEPWRELPAYLAMADSAGAFRFDSVAQGNYALFAFEDVNGNFAYDYGFENAAVGPVSLALTPRAEAQGLRLAAADTLPLRIVSAAFVADSLRDTATAHVPGAGIKGAGIRGRIKVEFSRAPHSLRAADAARYRILSDSAVPALVASAAWSPIDEAWMLDAGPLVPGRDYRVEMRSRPDFPGRDAGADTSVSFTANPPSDSTEWKFAFVRTSPASLRARPLASPLPAREFMVASNRPLNPARWQALNERLETRVDTLPTARTLTLVNPFTFSIQFSRVLQGGTGLVLRLRPAGADTAFRTLGALTILDTNSVGTVRVTPPARYAGWSFRLESLTASEDATFRVSADASTTVPVGSYRLSAFKDTDGDGLWNPGTLKPWVPQEPQARLLDSVMVKPRETADLKPR